MKKLEFESNGSKWMLVEADDEGYCFNTLQVHLKLKLSIGVFLKGITEHQASEVVESEYFEFINNNIYRDYASNNAIEVYSDNLTAIDSVHSLFKSKGVYLYESAECDNYFCDNSRIDMSYGEYLNCLECENIEENTFYNPVLFKILK